MPETALSIDQFLALLGPVKQAGANWQAKCPAHEDHRNSLSVGVGRDGKILVDCFAGCHFQEILAALSLTPRQLFPPTAAAPSGFAKAIDRTYDYTDAAGALLYQVCRLQPKDFRQRRPDPAQPTKWIWDMKGVTRIPYRLYELAGHETVYLVEGEKDADALWSLGLPATTNVGGAGKWRDSDSLALHSLGVTRLVLLPDNDSAGRKHTDSVARSVKAHGIAVMQVTLPNLPAKGDVSDWLTAGGRKEDLQQIVSKQLWVVPKGGSLETPPAPIDPAHDPTRWHQTDLGAAEAFVHRYGDHVRFDHLRGRWLVWDAHRWRPDATNEVHRLAHLHARAWQKEATDILDLDKKGPLLSFTLRLERRSGIDNLVSMANSLLPIADDGKDWDAAPMLLGCQNGVIDLTAGERRDGRTADRLTLQVGTRYDGESKCPRWLLFLLEIFGGDLAIVEYVQRALGYSLTANMREQCFFMCVGAGSNGKSTFLATLDAVWGDYAYTADMRTFAVNAGTKETETAFNLAELQNRRLILASETKANSKLNEDALKNFTGGEKINAQRKYGHPFEYLPVGKIWVGVNHYPRVFDDSHGFWRRVRIIPFNQTFSGTDDNRNLRDELRAEAAGILQWAILGCLQWQREGLNPPASIVTATDAYQQAEDPLTEFLAERAELDQAAETSALTSYAAYREWATDHGLSERERLSSTSFGRLLGRRFSSRHSMRGKVYLGLRITKRPSDLLGNL